MRLASVYLMPSWAKRFILLSWDAFSLVVAFVLAYWIRLGVSSSVIGEDEIKLMIGNVVLTLSLFLLAGLYRQMLRHLALSAGTSILFGVFASILYLLLARDLFGAFVPFSVPFIYCSFAILLIGGLRLVVYLANQASHYKTTEHCLIFGAEVAGRTLANALRSGNDLQPVAFIDDKKKYLGKNINGLPVHAKDHIPRLVKKHKVKKILLAVNNTSNLRRKELIGDLVPYAVELLTVPDVTEIASGKREIHELREVRIEELLGREPVPPIDSLLHINVTGKHVMVTGAGGSIGSELCRQIARIQPASLTLFELSEFNLYSIEFELRKNHPDLQINSVLASVQDNELLHITLKKFTVQTIYHAAAYKHVPMIENNISAGIRNNIFGTANVALCAAEYEVEKFVLISTDKAVRPTNIMGATKRFAELFVQGIAELHSETEFAIVRFGNVLGSSGSVVPVFDRQIKAGGPVTVTHPDIIRYFMTIPEAALLVIQAGSMGKDGEVFVLDMGDPVKIVDLAKKMAQLMGYSLSENPDDSGIKLEFSGLRPGEKLFEELLIDDAEVDTEHPRIMGANEVKIDFSEVVMLMDRLNYALVNHDEEEARQILLEAPLAYAPSSLQ
ncbi:polysaccharide biosynthesis protein [Alteromonas oceanisediminis]|uniref:polysaccharide biosynthesis protein n=1 Tax=Alteromonas oceanisediminis TaxID=2836180 RepID=UPI001BD9ADF6|nr:nucleoside-diphosphate sugar epimerase/dehydratase [Alteromonas oceanisediminis]MBT0587785.1 polysaccharide biosynthesis protein [Alteromonas oceanisediminis]